MNIEALCAAPPEALAHSPSQMPLSCPVAPGRPKLMPGCGPAGRRALAHADTPNTSPGCRSCASAPSPTGARPRRRAADLAALPKRTSHVAGLQTSPRFAPSHTLQRPYEETVRVVSAALLGTSHILRNILRRILRHVLHVQRGRRRACVGPGVSRRWKTQMNDSARVTRPSRHRRRPPPSPAPSPTPRPSRARPSRVAQGQRPRRAEDVSKTAPGPAASTTGSKSIAGR